LTEVKVKLTLVGTRQQSCRIDSAGWIAGNFFYPAVATNGVLELADVSMSSRPVSFPFNTLSAGAQPN